VQIDHVLYGVHDLADAEKWFADSYGLRTIGGGTHPDWGTANLIIPVGGDQYVELIGVVERSSEHPLARVLTSMVSAGDRPVAACLRPDDLDATARRLDLEITPATRTNPDGVTLTWRMAGLPAALGTDRLPFFIEWPGRRGNPELDGIGDSAAAGIAWVEFGGDPDRLHGWVGEDRPDIRTAPGDPGILQFALRRRDETVVIGVR
jgi:hypothetical protein